MTGETGCAFMPGAVDLTLTKVPAQPESVPIRVQGFCGSCCPFSPSFGLISSRTDGWANTKNQRTNPDVWTNNCSLSYKPNLHIAYRTLTAFFILSRPPSSPFQRSVAKRRRVRHRRLF